MRLSSGCRLPQHVPDPCEQKTVVGSLVRLHYDARVAKRQGESAVVDSSWDRGEPLMLKLGRSQVVRGLDDGLLDMCIGYERFN